MEHDTLLNRLCELVHNPCEIAGHPTRTKSTDKLYVAGFIFNEYQQLNRVALNIIEQRHTR